MPAWQRARGELWKGTRGGGRKPLVRRAGGCALEGARRDAVAAVRNRCAVGYLGLARRGLLSFDVNPSFRTQ